MTSLTAEQLNRLKESVLLEKIGYLCEELGDPGRYFPDLRSKNVLNTVDTQLIKTKSTDREKTEEFVTLISKRRSSHGQHGLDVFVDALKKQRVHAHVARTLLRALNKKKAEEERTSSGANNLGTSPIGHTHNNRNSGDSFVHTPTSDVSSNSATSSGQGLEYHPEHGALPPYPPPTSTQEDNIPSEPDDSVHPNYGQRPPSPPPLSTNQNEVSPEQEASVYVPPLPSVSGPPNSRHSGYAPLATHSQCSDSELGPQSIGHTETTMSSLSLDDKLNSYSTGDTPSTTTSTRSSYPSLATVDNTAAELDTLRKAFEKLKSEKKQLEVKYGEATQKILVLERENAKLREQVQQFQHQRPSNLHFHPAAIGGPPPPSYHYSSPASGSLTPQRAIYSTRNISPGPGPVGERDLSSLHSANSSGSINSFTSRGSYNPSESQV